MQPKQGDAPLQPNQPIHLTGDDGKLDPDATSQRVPEVPRCTSSGSDEGGHERASHTGT